MNIEDIVWHYRYLKPDTTIGQPGEFWGETHQLGDDPECEYTDVEPIIYNPLAYERIVFDGTQWNLITIPMDEL